MQRNDWRIPTAVAACIATLCDCSLPRCMKNNSDVADAIPAKVAALAGDELACHEAIKVDVSPVPFGGGWAAKGCARSAVYTCSCSESKAVDACNSECLNPKCEVYGCADEAVLMNYKHDKCVWRK